MSTISGSGTLTYSSGTFSYTGTFTSGGNANSWPITISAGVTVTIGSNLTITSNTQYFIIGGNTVTVDGSQYLVDLSGTSIGYSGFVQMSTSYSPVTVTNIGAINSSTTNSLFAFIISFSAASISSGVTVSNCFGISLLDRGSIVATTGGPSVTSQATIRNCYLIHGTDVNDRGILSGVNEGSISNCYLICGGGIFGCGIASGSSSSGSITNCYVICGGNIGGFAGGIVGGFSAPANAGSISNCYVICGGDIVGGGIAPSSNTATITNCYVNYNTVTGNIFAGGGTITGCNSQSGAGNWTATGAAYLDNSGSAWKTVDSTKPWLLSAFNTAVASSTATSSASGNIPLNTYGQSYTNGTVYSGQQTATFTYNAGSNITYSGLSSGVYLLGLYAYQLLSNFPYTFTFSNDAVVRNAFNYSGSNANNIVPYLYSVTDNVTLTYSGSSPTAVDCFLEGTKILTDRGYVSIEKLTKNNLIITSEGKKRIYKIGKCIMENLALQERIKDQLYVCSSSEYQQITEGDLVMTGSHSILVDSFENEQQQEDTKEILGGIFLTKDKIRLPVCLDKKSKVYEEKGEKIIYLIALEHTHYDCNYGIYANGLLVETCSQNYIDNKSKNVMSIIV